MIPIDIHVIGIILSLIIISAYVIKSLRKPINQREISFLIIILLCFAGTALTAGCQICYISVFGKMDFIIKSNNENIDIQPMYMFISGLSLIYVSLKEILERVFDIKFLK